MLGSCDFAAPPNANGIRTAHRSKPRRPILQPEKLRPVAPLIRHPGAPPICGTRVFRQNARLELEGQSVTWLYIHVNNSHAIMASR